MTLNRATIIGNVVRDPEARTTANGIAVTNFSVATNLIWTDQSGQRQELPEYHNIVAWRKLAEICAQYLKKGRKVYVDGRLQTRSWDDPNGFKRYRTEIVAENMIILDKLTDSGSGYTPGAYQPIARQPQAQPAYQPTSAGQTVQPAREAPASLPTDSEQNSGFQSVPVVDVETPAQTAGNNDEGQEEVSVEEIPF